MTWTSSLRRLVLVLFCCAAFGRANAISTTLKGSLAADDSVFSYTFINPSTASFNFYTTSYAGGINADGSVTPAGGFVPILTLFSSSTGKVVGFGGAGGLAACGGSLKADPTTHLCDDANFSRVLAAGTYILDLSEFPNVPIGNLSDGFLGTGHPSFTGENCGVRGGKFLEADVAPCVQRTANYAVDITTSPVPEPPTWLLLFSATAAATLLNRRRLA